MEEVDEPDRIERWESGKKGVDNDFKISLGFELGFFRIFYETNQALQPFHCFVYFVLHNLLTKAILVDRLKFKLTSFRTMWITTHANWITKRCFTLPAALTVGFSDIRWQT